MRRLLLLCLLVMLPFQGTWAAVAGLAALDTPCAAAQQATLHGDHGGDGNVSADIPDTMVDCDGIVPAEPCGDSGCSTCHGHALVALVGVPVVPGGAGAGGGVRAHCACGAPDHVPEQALRPPLSYWV